MKKTTKIAVLFVLGIALFIWFLSWPGRVSNCIDEVESCSTIEAVRTVWNKCCKKLSANEKFTEAVRNKLSSFNLQDSMITAIKTWLPPKTKNLNIILVPDLSRRIIDTVNNPDQIKTDKIILDSIWNFFVKSVRLKMNSKDRLIVDVTDRRQADGRFRGALADNLVFDLATHKKDQSNRIFFKEIGNQFQNSIDSLYAVARQQTFGADYVYYFTQKLNDPTRIKKSDLYDDYLNVLFFITDGYLETGPEESITPNASMLQRYHDSGDTLAFKYPRAPGYPNIEIYMFEIRERLQRSGIDFDGLKKWWTHWFSNIHISNIQKDFIYRGDQNALKTTITELKNIFDRFDNTLKINHPCK